MEILDTGKTQYYVSKFQAINVVSSHISQVTMIETSAISIREVQEIAIESMSNSWLLNGHFSLRYPKSQVITLSLGSHIIQGSFFLTLEYANTKESLQQSSFNFVLETMKSLCTLFGASAEGRADFIEGVSKRIGLQVESVDVMRSCDGSFSSRFRYFNTIIFAGRNF
jgi:hypothetical protein